MLLWWGKKTLIPRCSISQDSLKPFFWTCVLLLDPCYVDISLVVKYSQDINEQEVLDFAVSMLQTPSDKSEKKIIKQRKNRADNLRDGYVELCRPVQIYVLPKSGAYWAIPWWRHPARRASAEQSNRTRSEKIIVNCIITGKLRQVFLILLEFSLITLQIWKTSLQIS